MKKILNNKPMESLKKRFRAGSRHFCENTSMHGFSELYHSKSLFWTIVWAAVVSFALGITTYQVYKTTWQYIEQTTNTVIGPVDEMNMYYPPLQLCYWQWYFWVDWQKVVLLNCSKDALLYSVRYFNSIYSTSPFNIEKAKVKFIKYMQDNNLTSLFDFYTLIARTVPIEADDDIVEYFDKRRILYREPYLLFCYEISEENLMKYFSRNIHPKVISFYTKDESYEKVSEFVDSQEYNDYILRWADKSSMYKVHNSTAVDLTLFAPPISLFIFSNIPKGLEMVNENDAYIVDVRASVFTWLNIGNKVCDEFKREVASVNTTCQNLCEANFRRKACTCTRLDQAILLNVSDIQTICRKDIIFTNATSNEISNEAVRSVYECSTDGAMLEIWHKCMNECMPACQIWKYDKIVSTKTTSDVLRRYGTKNQTRIYIEYPSGKDIVIMTVQDAQSWENFVGNVGGLLGIWTGASIVSFLQMFYLCCCADCEGCCWPNMRLLLRRYWKKKGVHPEV